jgi:hypothetical protein
MLPGFRFLFAAIVLSMSILVFGLGAAALLRAAHEEVASSPSWRAAPEVMFAQPAEATGPVLAMLRVDMPVVEKAQDNAAATAEQAAISSLPAESERVATLKPEESSPPETVKVETAKAEIPVAESPASGEATPAPAEMPASADETRIATIATGDAQSPGNQAVPALSETMAAPVSPDAGIAETKIATLGGPAVSIETRPAKVSDAKPDQNALKNRQQARRAAQRRRIAARVAAQPAAQPAYPFGQPAPTIRNR